MKKLFYLLIFFVASHTASAQQEAQYTFFMYNQQQFNPGSVGAKEVGSFMALYRQQWQGFEGAPQSQLLSFQSPILDKKRAAVGLLVNHTSMGITNNWNASAAFSYKLPINDNWALRAGLQGVFRQQNINFQDEKVVLSVLDDPSLMMDDTRNQGIDFGFGLHLTHKDIFHFGVSIPHLLEGEFGSNTSNDIPEIAQYRRHIYFNAGAKVSMSENVDFSPNILVKYVQNAPVNFDVNLNFIFYQRFAAGVSLRQGSSGTLDSSSILALWQMTQNLGLGVAYDFTVSEINDYSSGSYEIMLRYDLGSERSDLENPRYF